MAAIRKSVWPVVAAALFSALVTGGGLWAAVLPTLVDRDEVRVLLERESPYVSDRNMLISRLDQILQEQERTREELNGVKQELAAVSASLSHLRGR